LCTCACVCVCMCVCICVCVCVFNVSSGDCPCYTGVLVTTLVRRFLPFHFRVARFGSEAGFLRPDALRDTKEFFT